MADGAFWEKVGGQYQWWMRYQLPAFVVEGDDEEKFEACLETSLRGSARLIRERVMDERAKRQT